MNIVSIKNDIILFKDETLKILRQIEKQLLEKIKLKDIETESKIADFDSKLSKFQEMNKRMYESFIEQQLNIEKLNHLNEFKSKTEARFISMDAKLINFFSDIEYMKEKYNKLFSETLTVPGVIGKSCKYNSISEYISDSINCKVELVNEKDIIKKEVDELKIKNNLFEKNFNNSIDNSVSVCKLYTDTKINEIKNYFNEKFVELNNILTNTKIRIEENILKDEQIITNIKNEIKNAKEEISNIFNEKNKDIETIKNETNNKDNEIKKEINVIKKDFSQLKVNVEKHIINENKLEKKIDNADNIINNLLFKTDKIFNEIKTNNNNLYEKKSSNSFFNNKNYNSNSNINNQNLFITHNINNNDKNNNDKNKSISNLFKKRNDIYKESSFKLKENNVNNNKEKFHIKIGEKEIKLTDDDNPNNENDYYFSLNILNNNNKNKENNILIPNNATKNKYYSYNKDNKNHNYLSSRMMKLEEYDNGALNNDRKKNLSGDNNFSEENNSLTNNINYNIENSNIDKDSSREKKNNIYFNKKNKNTQSKYIIHSIDKENTLSNSKRKITNQNAFLYDKDKYTNKNKHNKNIAIKLIKNKKEKINDSNLKYLHQQSRTLSLYKEYYERKIKGQKEKSKLDEIDKIPKKISPVFGRTAYIKFNKENDDINLKSHHNGNMNIIIDDSIDKNIYDPKLYTICENSKKKENKEDDPINLSV